MGKVKFNKQWKAFERKVAKKFNGKRVRREHWGVIDLDVVAEPFGIECKYRQVIEYEKALKECEYVIRNKKERRNLLPLAVVQRPGTKVKEEVVFRLRMLESLRLVTDVKEDVAENILIVPLKVFISLLESGGVQYGKRTATKSSGQ